MQTNAYVFYVNLNHVFLLCVTCRIEESFFHTKAPNTAKKGRNVAKKKERNISLSHFVKFGNHLSVHISLSFSLSQGSSLENTFATGKKKARVFRRFAFLPTTLSFSRIKEI